MVISQLISGLMEKKQQSEADPAYGHVWQHRAHDVRQTNVFLTQKFEEKVENVCSLQMGTVEIAIN